MKVYVRLGQNERALTPVGALESQCMSAEQLGRSRHDETQVEHGIAFGYGVELSGTLSLLLGPLHVWHVAHQDVPYLDPILLILFRSEHERVNHDSGVKYRMHTNAYVRVWGQRRRSRGGDCRTR